MTDKYSEAKLIREELAYIGRYLDGISPKLAKYQELMKRKEELRQKLKSLPKQAGSNPEPFKKWDNNFADIITPIIDEKKNVHSVHPLTKRSY